MIKITTVVVDLNESWFCYTVGLAVGLSLVYTKHIQLAQAAEADVPKQWQTNAWLVEKFWIQNLSDCVASICEQIVRRGWSSGFNRTLRRRSLLFLFFNALLLILLECLLDSINILSNFTAATAKLRSNGKPVASCWWNWRSLKCDVEFTNTCALGPHQAKSLSVFAPVFLAHWTKSYLGPIHTLRKQKRDLDDFPCGDGGVSSK